jgi:HAD superfamily hydrolase (TIGR01509 family)
MGPTSIVVLDAMGVIYWPRSVVQECLLPFAAARGCDMPAEQIRNAYLSCTVGEYPSAAFWEMLGIDGRPETLDEQLVREQLPMPGVGGFLRRMRSQGIAVACISNDVAEWAVARRRLQGIEPYVVHWVVSAQVGARKPDRGIYERFVRDTGAKPSACLFVDDRTENLDAARDLGFRTVLFFPEASWETAGAHSVASDFEDLEALVNQSVAAGGPDGLLVP